MKLMEKGKHEQDKQERDIPVNKRGVGNSPESSYTFGQNPLESQLFFS